MESRLSLSTSRIWAEFTGLQVLSVDLVVIDGPNRGRRVHVPDVARIGSASGNLLSLDDPTVSRVHCEVQARPEGVVVRDCESTNGTWVNGVRLREGEVQPGAVLHVGHSLVRVDTSESPSFLPISDRTSFGELLGASLEMRRVYAVLERVAQSNSTLLIEGETGTGKDVAARSLHAASGRASGPFVPVDCGAIPESLIESELFGHVRGAFSGAVGDRKGVFEEAHGGTLFLDEIGEMPLAVQAKLLRAIETRSVRRVGDNSERPIDVRIVAATNRSLASCANAGTFREDLYYRLAVVEVRIPPLSARREDIAPLAAHFHWRISGSDIPLPAPFLRVLSSRSWPGNVRELRNFIERSVSLGFVSDASLGTQRGTLHGAATEGMQHGVVPLHLPLKDARQRWTESFESIYVRSMLEKTGGNLTRAATLAGVNRRFMQRLVARLGLRASDAYCDEDDD